MAEVIVVIGAGQIGQAIARRVGVAKHVLLADMRPENANRHRGHECGWTPRDTRHWEYRKKAVCQTRASRPQND